MMKIFDIKNLVAVISGVMLALTLSVPAAYAADGDNGKHTGFEQGKHKGHSNEHGKRKGFENERNPWNAFYSAGVEFDLTIKDISSIPSTTFTITVNSSMAIWELLADLLDGESTDGYYLQECIARFDPRRCITITDCEDDEQPIPLDSSLTLEEAGLLDDPEVYLVYIPD